MLEVVGYRGCCKGKGCGWNGKVYDLEFGNSRSTVKAFVAAGNDAWNHVVAHRANGDGKKHRRDVLPIMG